MHLQLWTACHDTLLDLFVGFFAQKSKNGETIFVQHKLPWREWAWNVWSGVRIETECDPLHTTNRALSIAIKKTSIAIENFCLFSKLVHLQTSFTQPVKKAFSNCLLKFAELIRRAERKQNGASKRKSTCIQTLLNIRSFLNPSVSCNKHEKLSKHNPILPKNSGHLLVCGADDIWLLSVLASDWERTSRWGEDVEYWTNSKRRIFLRYHQHGEGCRIDRVKPSPHGNGQPTWW